MLPEPFWRQVILVCHDDFGHLGMETTLGLLKDRFFWPKMSEEMSGYTYVLVKDALSLSNPKNEKR